MNKQLHPLTQFSDEDIEGLAADTKQVGEFLIRLGHFLVEEHDRQLGAATMRSEIVRDSGFDHNPIHRERNGLVYRGNARSHALLHSEMVLGEDSILDVADEKEFGLIFGKYFPGQRIKVYPRRLTDLIFLLHHLSTSRLKLVILTGSLQQVLPRLFQQNSIAVDRDSVNTILTDIRYERAPSEKRRRELLDIIAEVERESQK